MNDIDGKCAANIPDYNTTPFIAANFLEYKQDQPTKNLSLKDGYFQKLLSSSPMVSYTYTVGTNTFVQSATETLRDFIDGTNMNNRTLTSITNLDPNSNNYLFSSVMSMLATADINDDIITKLENENSHYICIFNKTYKIALDKTSAATTLPGSTTNNQATNEAAAALKDAGKVSRILLILMLLTNAITVNSGILINNKRKTIIQDNKSVQQQVDKLMAIQNKLSGSKALYTTQKELQLYQEQMARKQNFANAGMAMVLLAATIGVILYIGNPIVTGVMTIAIITLALITLIATPVMAAIIGLIAAVAIIIVSTSTNISIPGFSS
jgi:hypothetical protein